ncbi:MAG: NAD(P)-dependent oxidoreductase [Bacteroidetes bacterium]|nr:NAD(P)-dependent oxidoreductase [Bacteroidota bacterium]
MERIGFIGLGLMGTVMVRRLLDAGYPVAVWNRTREKATDQLKAGATWSDSPEELAGQSTLVVTMLTTPEVVEEMAGRIRGASANGSVHVDCSTIDPATTQRLAELAEAEGQGFVHAPVLGSVPQLTEGSLVMFAGGKAEHVQRVRRVLAAFGQKVFEFPTVMQATNTKLLANFFIASMISALSQGIVFARGAGIEVTTLLEILSLSALNAPMYQAKGPAMAKGEYPARFYLEHMHKDVHLAARSAHSMGVALPSMPMLEDLFDRAMGLGLAKSDYSAVLEAVIKVQPSSSDHSV